MKILINCENSYTLAVPAELWEQIVANSTVLKREWKNSRNTLSLCDHMPEMLNVCTMTDAQIEAMAVARRMEGS